MLDGNEASVHFQGVEVGFTGSHVMENHRRRARCTHSYLVNGES